MATTPQPYSPYQAYQAPALPDPMPAKPSPFEGQGQGYQFQNGGGNITHGGAIAGIADNILRGFMNGKAQGEQYKALKLKKSFDDAKAMHQMASQQYLQAVQSGLDKSDPQEFAKIDAARSGAWNNLMSMYGQHIEPQKKSGKQSKVKEAGNSIMQMLTSKDPAQMSQALYQVAQKAGDPTVYQAKQLQSQMQAQTAQAQPENDLKKLTQTNALTKEKDIARRNELLAIDSSKLSEAQRSELSGIERRLSYAQPKTSGTTRLYKLKDGTQNWFVPGNEPEGASAVSSSSSQPKTGTFGEAVSAYAKEHGKEVGDLTEEDIDTVRHHWAQSGHIAGVGRGGAGGTKKATPAQFATLDRTTSASYAKADKDYQTKIAGIDADVAAKKLSADGAKTAREKATAEHEAEKRRIADSHDQQVKDLGGEATPVPGFAGGDHQNNPPTTHADGKITVTAPDGSTYPFETQEQADAFKKAAGIK